MACKPACLNVEIFQAGAGIGYQDGQAPGDPGEVFGARKVLAFGRLHAGMRDALAEIAVAHAVLGDEHQAKRRPLCRAQAHFGPDQQRNALGACLCVGAHDASHRALVGDGDRPVAQLRRLCDQALGRGGTAQERKIGDAVEFSVSGQICGGGAGSTGGGTTGIRCIRGLVCVSHED